MYKKVLYIWLLSKIKGYLSKEHRLTYYKSYIQPHLDYSNIVWGSTSKTNLMQIERLQRRACRIMLVYNVDNIYQSMNDLTRKSVHGTRMPPPIVFTSPAIKHWVFNKT